MNSDAYIMHASPQIIQANFPRPNWEKIKAIERLRFPGVIHYPRL
jgi:hypothetical protein